MSKITERKYCFAKHKELMMIKFQPHELDDSLAALVRSWDSPPTALQVFRVYDEITLMEDDQRLVSFRLFKLIEGLLAEAMTRENTNEEELSNRALWRDQEF
jgi:hypothetical protein